MKNNEIQFEINSKEWMDPYSTHFEFRVVNRENSNLQLDNSIHSLFESVVITVNGRETERMSNYPIMSKIYFDMNLTNSDRKNRNKYEGFGLNDDGTGETILAHNHSYMGIGKNDKSNDGNKMIENVVSRVTKIKTKEGYLFKVPLMSKFFGLGIEEKNWHLIPLKNMKITIQLNTNPYAFFKPIDNNSFSGSGQNKTLNNEIRNYKISILEPHFCFTEYTFFKEFDDILMNKFETKGMYYDYIDYEIIDKWSLVNETAEFLIKFNFKRDMQGVRGLFFFAMDSSYLVSPYARPLARLNLGFSMMQMITDKGNWPNSKFFNDWEINNANTGSLPSAKPILEQIGKLQTFKSGSSGLLKKREDDFGCFNQSVLTRKWDTGHLAARAAMKGLPISVNLSNSLITNPKNENENTANLGCCNTIVSLNFDNIPSNSGKIIGGVKFNGGENLYVGMYKKDASINTTGYDYLMNEVQLKEEILLLLNQRQDIYKTAYLVCQVYKRSVMDVYGNITHIRVDSK